MKKHFLLFYLFSFIFSLSEAHAYTSTDVSNASFLATEGIIVQQSSASGYRLDDTITRAEVVGIALKLKWVPLPSYRCKGYYADTRLNDWICRAVEIAADNGLVSRVNAWFRPQDKITRAEALGIFMNSAGDVWDYECTGCGMLSIDSSVGWHRDVFLNAYSSYGIQPIKKVYLWGQELDSKYMYYFEPSRPATRAEVFGFARNIMGNKQEQYGWFSADFWGVFEKTVLESSGVFYGFGDKVNFEYWLGYKYSIHVEPVTTHFLVDPSESLEKKSWNGNVYYATMVSWMCYTGKLIFLWKENTILITGACNESIEEVEAALRKIYFQPTDVLRGITSLDVLSSYYKYLSHGNNVGTAYDMRLPAWVPLETFQSWYKNVTSVVFREDTIKSLGDNTYEFLVDTTENGVKSTFKVKSKVDLLNFKINNLSSVKQ